ncbi:MAG TPA: serine/threonine-protein kinase [Kofleriaceae bacterium]|nr:serine/threonine-protein kinase [Kofleriaceae bacterium]
MGVRGVPDDDRPTVDLGPRAPTDELAAQRPLDGADETESIEMPVEMARAIATGSDASAGATVQGLPPDVVHALPTQQLPNRPPRQVIGATPSISRNSGSVTATSPVEAMRLDEIQRTRVFLKVAIATCVAAITVVAITGHDASGMAIIVSGCTIVTIGAVWILALMRQPDNYVPRRILPGVLLIALGAMGGVFYWGAASPVAAMVVYGIYFFSLGANARITTAMYVLVAILHGAIVLAIIFGAIEDRGMIQMSGLRTLDQVAILAVIEFLYFIAFYTARVSQKVTLDAVTQLEQAARTVAQRDALLAEARAELDRALKIGGPGRFTEQVVGAFRLGVLIGRGGMGEVYEAFSVADRREAAVKLLHAGTLADPTHVQRFLREAQTAARLDCPHVVRVLEVGTTSGEVPFLAMERLRGHDLAHQLRRHRKLQLAQAKILALQIAEGLEAARKAGIVHRDLKPHNVFLAVDGEQRHWKILDFGVSKSGGSGTLTKGHVVGTPAYMAPEQARGEDVDHRADVYSLAAILYRAVTGHPAFSGKDVPTTLYEVVYRVPTQPSILANISADIDRVLAIGLAKDPRDRFSSAVELARWFATACDGQLDPDQRRRGDDVIAKYPWGTRPGMAAIA